MQNTKQKPIHVLIFNLPLITPLKTNTVSILAYIPDFFPMHIHLKYISTYKLRKMPFFFLIYQGENRDPITASWPGKGADPGERQREIRIKGKWRGRISLVQKTSLGTLLASCPHSIRYTEIKDSERIGPDIFGNVTDRRKRSWSGRMRVER